MRAKNEDEKQSQAVGIVLKKGRIAQELTQAAVARRLGRTQSYVAKVEQGRRKISFIDTVQFLKIYRISPDRFIGMFLKRRKML